MHFVQNEIYHLYNRGNHKQPIFFNEENYLFFIKKIRNEWIKYCDILCYCLMPNHFHLMIVPNEVGCKNISLAGKETHLQQLSKAIGITLSSYTKAINIQNHTTGNLFQKKSQAKCLSDKGRKFSLHDYVLTCFYYIHENPLMAKLVNDLKDWHYSSYPDYYGYRNGTLCNKPLAMKLFSMEEDDLKGIESQGLKKKIINELF